MPDSPSFASPAGTVPHELASALFDAAVDGLIVIDGRGVIRAFNRGATAIFGYAEHEAVGQNVSMLMLEPDARHHDGHMDHYRDTGQKRIIGIGRDVEGRRKDGSAFPMRLSIGQYQVEGQRYFIGICHDVTEVRDLIASLALSEQRYEDIASRQTALVYRFDPQWRLTYVNDAYCRYVRTARAGLLGASALDGVHESDRDHFQGRLRNLVRDGEVSRYEQRFLLPSGEIRWLEREDQAIMDHEGVVREYQSVCTDITERRLAQERANFLATHDSLTGCANRELFNDRLRQATTAGRHKAARFAAVLLVGLDDFKRVNDEAGYAVGDRVLLEVSRRLARCLRDGDTLARVGGDEFAILVQGDGRGQDLPLLAESLIDAFDAPFLAGTAHVRIQRASIGVSLFPGDGSDGDELSKSAALAMHQAKSLDGGRFQFFTAELQQHARHARLMAGLLRQALAEDRFELHYQLQFQVDTLQIEGMEALIRWQHEGRAVSPGEFLPFAAELGLMPEITRWVLHRACMDNRFLIDQGVLDVPVAVNISAPVFQQPDFVESVRAALMDTGLPGRKLDLEITEEVALSDSVTALANMRALRKMGILLSLDDFGTGFSSLSYLKQFAFDRIKIDRSFICDLPDNLDNVAISRAVLKIAESMGMGVVAEGVETREQLDFLRDNRCLLGQGYWFSKPLPLPALIARVRERRGRAD